MTTKAEVTIYTTTDGLTIYDLDPYASELWAVAGPAGIDPATIDPDALPEGFRWVTDAEWARIQRDEAEWDDNAPPYTPSQD